MNSGIRWFMRLSGMAFTLVGWFPALRGQVDLAGADGTANIEISGSSVYTWHLEIAGRRMTLREGAAPLPAATVRLTEATLVDLLTGRTQISTVQMTGRICVEGEAFFGMILAGMCLQFRRLAVGQSRIGRSLAAFVLRRLNSERET